MNHPSPHGFVAVVMSVTAVLSSLAYLRHYSTHHLHWGWKPHPRTRYEPIDVVYTWVNGSDPIWREKKAFWLAKELEKREADTAATADAAVKAREADGATAISAAAALAAVNGGGKSPTPLPALLVPPINESAAASVDRGWGGSAVNGQDGREIPRKQRRRVRRPRRLQELYGEEYNVENEELRGGINDNIRGGEKKQGSSSSSNDPHYHYHDEYVGDHGHTDSNQLVYNSYGGDARGWEERTGDGDYSMDDDKYIHRYHSIGDDPLDDGALGGCVTSPFIEFLKRDDIERH